MDANESFEIEAEAFHQMTGFVASGKDDCSGIDRSIRTTAWELWRENNGSCIHAMLRAFEKIMGR